MMTDELKQLFRDVLMLVLGGASGFLTTHWRRPQETRDTHAEKQMSMIERQSKTLEEAFTQIDEDRKMIDGLIERMDKLERENRKYRNGYARAIRYIYEKNPLESLPNFLIDTGDAEGKA